LMPALIGAALAARGGTFLWLRFLLVLVGLAAAEMLNLLGSDYRMLRRPQRKEPRLPRIPLVLAPVALIGLAAALYFTFTAGIGVLIFLAAAAVIGALYVFSPFQYAFLYTAFIPPLISAGAYLAITGRIEGLAFAAGIPITLISLAVIVGYRVMYGQSGSARRRSRAVVLALYCLAGINVVLYVPADIYPWTGLAALVPIAVFLCLLGRVSTREREDPVPVTALGVMMHTSTCLVIAAAVLFG